MPYYTSVFLYLSLTILLSFNLLLLLYSCLLITPSYYIPVFYCLTILLSYSRRRNYNVDKAAVKEIFDEFDADKDGSLTMLVRILCYCLLILLYYYISVF
jgi:hypothetical protein